MALIELEYAVSDSEKVMRSWQIPDDVFIRKLKIRRADGQVVWSVEFDYDWLREFMAKNLVDRKRLDEIQANSSGV